MIEKGEDAPFADVDWRAIAARKCAMLRLVDRACGGCLITRLGVLPDRLAGCAIWC